MKLRLRLLSYILTFALTAGNLLQLPVYADEKMAAAEEGISESKEELKNKTGKELTGLEILDLSEPVAEKPLDPKATVRSAEGVTWEIPVVWIGEDGKAATVAEPGKKYVPNFAFYVPKGYKVKGAGTAKGLNIKLPGFLKALGMEELLFVADPSNGLTYITWDMTKVLGTYAMPHVFDPSASENKAADRSESDHTDNDDDDDNNNESPFWEVNVHCTENVIANVGYETLARLVHLIKSEIEPRAMAALLDGFPAFAEAAARGEIGSSIGLYIYDSRFDSEEDARNVGGSTNAYVMPEAVDESFAYYIGVNCNRVLTVNASGEYELDEGGLTSLKNAVIHELMHAVMFDYTRTGMLSNDNASSFPSEEPKQWNGYPKWFVEGTASAVQDVYRYQRIALCYLSTVAHRDYERTPDEPLFQDWTVDFDFRYKVPGISASLATYRTNYEEDLVGCYVGGYLAVVYLSTLVANDGSIPEGDPDSSVVRRGLNSILEQLHDGTPLDSIIRSTGKYNGIIEFEDKFGTRYDAESLGFCVDFLNYLDSVTPNPDKLYTYDPAERALLANGSILIPFDDIKSSDPFVNRTETSKDQSILKIADTNGAVISTAHPDSAGPSAGSYHTWDDITDGGLEEGEAAAAATQSLPEETELGDPSKTEEPEVTEDPEVVEEPALSDVANPTPAAGENPGSDESLPEDTVSDQSGLVADTPDESLGVDIQDEGLGVDTQDEGFGVDTPDEGFGVDTPGEDLGVDTSDEGSGEDIPDEGSDESGSDDSGSDEGSDESDSDDSDSEEGSGD